MNVTSCFGCLFRLKITRLVTVLLVALACSVPACIVPPSCSPILDAARDGDMQKIKKLLDRNPEMASCKDTKDPYGYTPLHLAVKEGHKDVMQLLLANGAEVNAKDNYLNTSFSLALKEGRKDMAELLLANAADINVTDMLGRTPLHWAAAKGYKDLTQSLLDKKSRY